MKYVARKSHAGVILVLLVFAFSACSNQSGDAVPESDEALIDSEPVAMGELQYTIYCASCHGEDGKGDGPVAEALVVRPTNLTLLKSINDGVFPADRLVAYIDGREDVQAHGTRQMPVWGNIWDEIDGKKVDEQQVQQRINELVEYIRSIQE
ncbi:MAG: cytochrome c [Rhodothermia bacterium]|nr:cytochrome c [Rhodothermia bacterium]